MLQKSRNGFGSTSCAVDFGMHSTAREGPDKLQSGKQLLTVGHLREVLAAELEVLVDAAGPVDRRRRQERKQKILKGAEEAAVLQPGRSRKAAKDVPAFISHEHQRRPLLAAPAQQSIARGFDAGRVMPFGII